MFRTRLMTAAAAAALFAAPAAFAQDAMSPTPQDPAPTQPAEATAQPAPQAAPAQAQPAIANNLIDVLKADGRFTTLLSAIEQAQLTNVLQTTPAISIFAPTDEAFAALPEADRTRLMDPANAQELRELLLYHVIVADVSSSQIAGALGPVETAAGSRVQLDGTGEAIKIDQATVVQADIDAGNGAVFAIDTVLNPANSQAAMGDEEAAPAAEAAPAQTSPAEVDETAPVTEAVPAETAPVPTPAEETTPVTETMPSEAAPAPVPSEEAAPVPTEDPATETPPADGEAPTDPQ